MTPELPPGGSSDTPVSEQADRLLGYFEGAWFALDENAEPKGASGNNAALAIQWLAERGLVSFRYDDFAQRAEVVWMEDGGRVGAIRDWHTLDNADVSRLAIGIEQANYNPSAGAMERGLATVVHQCAYNPIIEHMESCVREWRADGASARRFSDTIGLRANTRLSADETAGVCDEVLELHVRALFARIASPGIKYDRVVILDGPAGSGKTTFAETMLPHRFVNANLEVTQFMKVSEFLVACQGIGVGVWDEVELAAGKLRRWKSWVSGTHFKARLPYGRATVDIGATWIHFGTTNDPDYIPNYEDGMTRRIAVVQIDGDRKIACTRTATDSRRWWRLVLGERWEKYGRACCTGEQPITEANLELPDGIQVALAKLAEEATHVSEWEEHLLSALEGREDVSVTVQAAEAMLQANGFRPGRGGYTAQKIAGTLRRNGFKRERLRQGGSRRVCWAKGSGSVELISAERDLIAGPAQGPMDLDGGLPAAYSGEFPPAMWTDD